MKRRFHPVLAGMSILALAFVYGAAEFTKDGQVVDVITHDRQDHYSAANAALDTGASIAVPIHFGLYKWTEADAKGFARLLQGKVEVIELEKAAR